MMIKNEKGLTLVEVLAVIIISSLVIATVTYVMQYTLNNYRATSERQEAQSDAMHVTELIIKSVRERSNQNLNTDGTIGDCVVHLEYSVSGTTYRTCYSFDQNNGTLSLIKSENDTITLNQVISSKLANIDVDIVDEGKIELTLHYTIMRNTDFKYETTVYIPKL